MDQVDRAGNEATLVVDTSRKLLNKYSDKGYNHSYNRQFTGLPKSVGFNHGLFAPQPEFVEGLETEEYRPFPVNDRIPGALIYKDGPRSLALPHFAGEWKGPDGSVDEARIRGAYDGAALIYARTRAHAYMGKEDPPGHAEITTFTIDDTNLSLYPHYAAPSAEDGGTLQYHQYLVSSTNLTSTYQGYEDGRKSIRNAQDHAKTRSEQLRDQLMQHWKQNRNKHSPVPKKLTSQS